MDLCKKQLPVVKLAHRSGQHNHRCILSTQPLQNPTSMSLTHLRGAQHLLPPQTHPPCRLSIGSAPAKSFSNPMFSRAVRCVVQVQLPTADCRATLRSTSLLLDAAVIAKLVLPPSQHPRTLLTMCSGTQIAWRHDGRVGDDYRCIPLTVNIGRERSMASGMCLRMDMH